MGKGIAVGLLIFGLALSAGLVLLEYKHHTVLLTTSMKLQKKITKPPKHTLYYVMKVFEWGLLGLTWGVLFLTLYFEFNKLSSWKILTFSWGLYESIEITRMFLRGPKPIFLDNTFASSGCECYFGTPSWYAGFVVMFWFMFYKDILSDRDFLEDSHKLIIKIVLVLLVFLGIFARFFFGLETFNQIFIGIAFALMFFGLSCFTEFWETQFSQVFNSDSSSCFSRWLAFLLSFGFIADFVFCWFLAKKNITTFEKKQVHPFAKSTCKTQCFKSLGKPVYLSNNSLIGLAWFSFVPMMFLYYALTSSVKYSNNQLNMIKYIAQFKDVKGMVMKVVLYTLVNVPIIVSAWYTIKKDWKLDLIFKFGMSFLWVIMYRWIAPVIKKSSEIFVMADMFAPWMDGDDEAKEGLI